MDNLFVLMNLARATYAFPTRVAIHGVIRKSGRGCGVRPCVLQEELTGKRAEAVKVKGTVKAAVVKGNSKADNLTVTSCHLPQHEVLLQVILEHPHKHHLGRAMQENLESSIEEDGKLQLSWL